MNLDGTKITWLGHATFLIDSPKGIRIVTDPWLKDNPKCPPAYHELDRADILTVSHGHFDHLGSAADLAKRTGASVVSNFEIVSYLQAQGVDGGVGMNKGGTVEVRGIRLTLVHAVHSSGISTDHGLVYGGEAGGFVIQLENGLVIYHAGDTNVFSDMALIKELYRPDIALLPIGGHFTMAPKEAAYAVRLLGPKVVIPMHYGTFPVLAGTPEAFRDLVGDQAEVVVLEPGGTYA
ncbi:MAG: metal-dependent hydrolase [Actinomycetia bacterium]|nr:metal-dependent hydrolase [Actinomycetes bacterium]